jgi:hypothetical protein
VNAYQPFLFSPSLLRLALPQFEAGKPYSSSKKKKKKRRKKRDFEKGVVKGKGLLEEREFSSFFVLFFLAFAF